MNYLLGERRLARLATVGTDGTPHIAPVGWSFNYEKGTIDIGGSSLERTKKYRDVQKTGRAARRRGRIERTISSVNDGLELGAELLMRPDIIRYPCPRTSAERPAQTGAPDPSARDPAGRPFKGRRPVREAIMNAQWHATHKMPRRATLDQRIQWHLDHAKQCACRPIPPRLLQEIRRRKNAKLTT